jgi:hypothetical protein
LTHTDGSKYTDFTVDTNHDLLIQPSSTGQIKLQPTTDSTDFFQVLDADGGDPVLNVDATNERVGIGTASPQYELEVNGDVWLSGGTDSRRLALSTTNNRYFLQVEDTTFDGIGIYKAAPAPQEWLMVIENSGEVGIGLTNPSAPLHVLTDDAGANVDLIKFERTSDSPADDDSYDIIFSHEVDGSPLSSDFAQLTLIAEDVSDGTEKGLLKFSVADGVDGSMDEAMRIGKGDGTTDVDITFITLRNADGELCYIYPNADQNGIIVSSTHP